MKEVRRLGYKTLTHSSDNALFQILFFRQIRELFKGYITIQRAYISFWIIDFATFPCLAEFAKKK